MKSKNCEAIPFKALIIDCIDPLSQGSLPAEIYIQCIAAGQEPTSSMYPVRFLYSSENTSTDFNLLINGDKCTGNLEERTKPEQLQKFVEEALADITSNNKIVISEGTGGIVEWQNSIFAEMTIEKLDPQILLVADFAQGGGLAATIGTLELLDERLRSRIAGIVFNRLDQEQGVEFVKICSDTVTDRFGLQVFGTIPRLSNIRNLCEDKTPVADASVISAEVNIVADVMSRELKLESLGAAFV